jgi:hypothetical protein
MVTTTEAIQGDVGPGDGADSPAPGLISNISALGHALTAAFAQLSSLIVIETRLTARHLAVMLIACLFAVLVLTTGWFGTVIAMALALASLGMPPAAAVMVVVLFNLMLLPLLFMYIRSLSRKLGYPETRDTVSKALDTILGRSVA